MKELGGKISDKLRERFPADAQEWSPPRPGETPCPPEQCRKPKGS